jgi:hypothetical protein
VAATTLPVNEASYCGFLPAPLVWNLIGVPGAAGSGIIWPMLKQVVESQMRGGKPSLWNGNAGGSFAKRKSRNKRWTRQVCLLVWGMQTRGAHREVTPHRLVVTQRKMGDPGEWRERFRTANYTHQTAQHVCHGSGCKTQRDSTREMRTTWPRSALHYLSGAAL